jgi:hypothetical protein
MTPARIKTSSHIEARIFTHLTGSGVEIVSFALNVREANILVIPMESSAYAAAINSKQWSSMILLYF